MLIVAQAEIVSLVSIAGLLTIFVFFYIDAIIFPTLPELVAVLIFLAEPTAWFALAILLTIMLAEFLGFNTLYIIVKRVRVPKIIRSAAQRYCQFLLVSKEKVILVNRVAPVVPFVGAFAALENWDWGKCVLYTFVGGLVKYGAILALANVFAVYLKSDLATLVTILMVLAVIAISFAWSYHRRKRKIPAECGEKEGEKGTV
jgi:hypothetical protein